MKGNKINGILWILIGIFLTGLLIRGIKGKSWGNIPFSFHIGPKSEISSEEGISPDSKEKDFSVWNFEADSIDDIKIELVSSNLLCVASDIGDSIKVEISNDVDVRKYYIVELKGNKLSVRNKPVHQVGFGNGIRSSAKEVVITLPFALFDHISVSNVSGRTELKNLNSRKFDIESVSGKLLVKDLTGKVKLSSVSGKIEYYVSDLKNDIDIESVSGKIEMELPQNSDFICSYETISGSIDTDFKKHGKKSGEIVNGSETNEIHIETVSGGIAINSQ